jgi:septum formation protein
MPPKLVLASASPFRRHLMEQAGLVFTAESARIDERAAEAPIRETGSMPEEIARALAIAKAADVASRHPGKFVIGSDQIMSMDGTLFHKCETVAQAKAQLAGMRGKTHQLSSAVAILKDGQLLWSEVAIAEMTFRQFSDRFLDTYIDRAGDNVLLSVGAYQYEGLGQQLFEKISGDYFTIIGLPMLPLLKALRTFGIIVD